MHVDSNVDSYVAKQSCHCVFLFSPLPCLVAQVSPKWVVVDTVVPQRLSHRHILVAELLRHPSVPLVAAVVLMHMTPLLRTQQLLVHIVPTHRFRLIVNTVTMMTMLLVTWLPDHPRIKRPYPVTMIMARTIPSRRRIKTTFVSMTWGTLCT
jgi:hypothetical protein